MKFKSVHYSALINLGNYNNEKIGFTATVEDNESVEEVVENLRQKVFKLAGKNAEKIMFARYKAQRDLEDLQNKIKKATEQWNDVAEFLRAQGIKPDAPNMPQLTNLLPQVETEEVNIVDGDIELDYDEDEGHF